MNKRLKHGEEMGFQTPCVSLVLISSMQTEKVHTATRMWPKISLLKGHLKCGTG